MIVLEHDAKELLAVQGMPVPGGIQLTQVPKYDPEQENEKAGPWLIKPQIESLDRIPHNDIAVAATRKEVADECAKLLGTQINGHRVNSVRVERQILSDTTCFLSFSCDPIVPGVRVAVAANSDGCDPGGPSQEVAAPDPTAVVACVSRLAATLPETVRDPIIAAATQLAPLYFGYEALQIEISPLVVLPDGSWMAGDVKMIIDECALFRHPELISMIERRDFAYDAVRRKRTYGLDYLVLDPAGDIGTLSTGQGLGAHLVDEMRQHGLNPYNYLETDTAALIDTPASITEAFRLLSVADGLKAILITALEDDTPLTELAALFAQTLSQTPELTCPIVLRMTGPDAETAGALLCDARPNIELQATTSGALDRLAELTGSKAAQC